MLRQLVINDLAVIDSLNIEFNTGMTVLTGETGAGKSILLDALGLILGDRADSSIIRGDINKTDITAIFSLEKNNPLIDKLKNMDIETEDELYIRRTVSSNGPSRAYLNNTPVPAQTLKEIGEYLIDIHGQHAHQSLSRAETQRSLLDESGNYTDLINEIKQIYQEHQQICDQLNSINTGGEDFDARVTLLKYQIEELNELSISENEYQDLSEQHKRLSNAQNILNDCHLILTDFTDSESSIRDRLTQHQNTILNLVSTDSSLNNINKLIESAGVEIEEATSELRDYIDQFDDDPEKLNILDKRITKIHELSRKHKVKPEQLHQHLDLLISQLNQLEGGQEQLEILKKRKKELLSNYFELSKTLHKKRISNSEKISVSVTNKMQELGMGGEFKISVEEIEDDTIRKFGMDKITFMVSTNAGQPLKPITKVASGGELSRLSLAIQIVGLNDKNIPTMIFDEVDSGISGSTAEIVGKMLNKLADERQILCVTHLAQVASCGHNHLRVVKTTRDNETFTEVIELGQIDRIDEVARLLAGIQLTDESRANAAKMLESV